MTFSETEVRRDAGGKFAEKLGASPEVTLPPAPFESYEVRGVKPGDLVDTESNTHDGPFDFAFMHNRAFRQAWKSAGRPRHLRVLQAGRAKEDGHTDNAIIFDLGGEPFELTFHRDREMLVSRPNKE
jgi:hypothetical protein